MHGGNAKWSLPEGDEPGTWMPEIADIRICERGYHAVELPYLIEWLGPQIWEMEVAGHSESQGDKSVWSRARIVRATHWNDKTARLFAADCAEQVLPNWEREYPDNDAPRLAIAAARDYARGLCSGDAMAAASSVASRAACSAADRAGISVAYSAAHSAACSAVHRAASSVASSVAYRAACSAADRAGISVAYRAAHSAARSAGISAGISAEREWQAHRLGQYVTGEVGQ